MRKVWTLASLVPKLICFSASSVEGSPERFPISLDAEVTSGAGSSSSSSDRRFRKREVPRCKSVAAEHDDIGVHVEPSGTFNDQGGNLAVDPKLHGGTVDLTAASPLIDAGTCTGVPATDIEGDPRPSGGGCDIGADEFVP